MATENLSLSEVLNRICALDGRYGWSRDGNSINLFPKASLNDQNYFFSRALRELSLRDIRKVADAVLAIDRESGDPSGGVIYMGIGPAQTFAEPWNAEFTDITVRQALNQVARHLGPTYGWQIGGTTKARLILFHYKLEAQQPKVGDQYTTPTH